MRLVQAVAASLAIITTQSAVAHQFEAATAVYSDDDRRSILTSGELQGHTNSLFTGQGQDSTLTLGYSVKKTEFKDTVNNAYVINQQLQGTDYAWQQSFNASLDQGIVQGTNLGLFGGNTSSLLGSSKWYGVRAGQWWREDTLQTVLEARRTTATQLPAQVYDDEKRLIRLPEDVAGNNISLSVTHYTTPNLILRGQASRTTRSDRPDADGVSGEARYFVTPTDSAVHLGVGHYENVGQIDTTSDFGSIVANTVYGEWHQAFLEHGIVMVGYRTYQEIENPQGDTVDNKHLGTDWIYSNLRWRFDDGLRTSDAAEVYVFCGRYKTSEPRAGNLIGLGGKVLF